MVAVTNIVILVGRCIIGFAIGLGMMTSPAFIAEVSAELRGVWLGRTTYCWLWFGGLDTVAELSSAFDSGWRLLFMWWVFLMACVSCGNCQSPVWLSENSRSESQKVRCVARATDKVQQEMAAMPDEK